MEGKKIVFQMSKEKFYRVIHMDGAFGGITGGGLITCDLYTERPSHPQETTIEIDETGQVICETDAPTNPPITRIVQMGLVMTPAAAHALGEWLIRNAADAMRRAAKGIAVPGTGSQLPN